MSKFIAFFFFSMQLFAVQGVLIPFYHYPHYRDLQVEELIKLKKRFPHVRMITIINPDNGYVKKEETNFAIAVQRLSKAGIETIGYLHTSYAARPLQEVKDNLHRWVKYYKKYGISGIFLDEVNCSASSYYTKLAERIRTYFPLVVANPGVFCDINWSDIVVVHENSRYPTEEAAKKRSEAVLVYNAQKLNMKSLKEYGYVYITELNGTNPWEKLSSYLPQILRFIEGEFQKDLNKKAVQLQVQSHE